MPDASIDADDYAALAEIRYRIRRFLVFSELGAREAGVEPQQHQLLLALKALPSDHAPTIGVVAERLSIQHHSAVELVSRSVEHGLVGREKDERDGRKVLVVITKKGERLLRKLSLTHRDELRSAAPALLHALAALVAPRGKRR